MYDIKSLENQIKEVLTQDRYEHTIGVMYTAQALAMCYGENLNRAAAAGLLHDCAKCISNEKKLKLCEEYKIPVSAFEAQNPSLLHAKLGAYLAEKVYGVQEKEILSAISCHTTGKPAMSLLEMILYIADYIEPGRNQAPDLLRIRKLAFSDLEEAVYEVLEGTLSYLKSRGQESIDPLTQETYEYYQRKRSK